MLAKAQGWIVQERPNHLAMLDAVSNGTYQVVQHWAGYQPLAVCLPQHPVIFAAEVLTNAGIALAYFMIPFALWRFLRNFPTLPFRSVWVMFVILILACGTSHLSRVLNLFLGGWTYWLDVVVCGVTLVASLGTAIGLLRHGRRIVLLTHDLLAVQR
jgi:hypothetical protein